MTNKISDDDDDDGGIDFLLFFIPPPPPDDDDDEVGFDIIVNVNESAICTTDNNDRSNNDMYKNAARRFDKWIIILTPTSNNLSIIK